MRHIATRRRAAARGRWLDVALGDELRHVASVKHVDELRHVEHVTVAAARDEMRHVASFGMWTWTQ